MTIPPKKPLRSLATPILALVLGVGLSIGATYVYAWTGPTGTAPNNNTPPPINTSATAQTKSGGLTAGWMQAPIFYDSNNAGYYLDPNGTSRVGQANADNTYTYGNENANDYYVRAVGRWASAPAVSMDCYDTGYYQGNYCDGGGYKFCRTCVNNTCSNYVMISNTCGGMGSI
ncbi:TPA: hypothetical protein DIV48_01045 [Candidatus Kaiserbacteria bacterium]|nr:MAG: hypothetical protein UY93_C0002G0163 [Parcubacteria group bacterium GW2011_GWA1_56_13]KKW46784.1 MAG: hypothetical protein UY97_C0003G0058 [Parcubacteria group bacterium GW2011_GWB1_57_6]HCR52217.1 hypothetical protein [Candidatus Kaiserbacteria bacterium]